MISNLRTSNTKLIMALIVVTIVGFMGYSLSAYELAPELVGSSRVTAGGGGTSIIFAPDSFVNWIIYQVTGASFFVP